jgi:hypothetical protein
MVNEETKNEKKKRKRSERTITNFIYMLLVVVVVDEGSMSSTFYSVRSGDGGGLTDNAKYPRLPPLRSLS